MKKTMVQSLLCAAAGALFGLMAGCSDSKSPTPPSFVSGVAASGAPLTGTVTLKDSAGSPKTADINSSDGTYSIDVTGLQAPFILKAGPQGAEQYSFAEGPGTANINPLSSIIVANAARTTDAATAYDAANPTIMNTIKTNLGPATTNIQTRLNNLLKNYAGADIDPIKGAYRADHQGLDQVFDDAEFTVTSGRISIKNRKNKDECFSGNLIETDYSKDVITQGNLPTGLPAAPTVTVTAGVTQNTLSWPAVSSATSYNLYFSNYSGVTTANGTTIANVTSPYTHTGLTAGSAYYYILTAMNANGASQPSAQATATPTAATTGGTAPAAPTLTATAGAAQNSITWPAVSGATSYDLYWSTTTGVTTSGTKIPNVTSPYTHASLTNGTAYYYILTATNAAGTSPASAEATATPTAATPAPDGAALYATNCAGCHGPLATSEKRGRTAAQISAAIAANRGGMSSLAGLPSAHISAIAGALFP